MTHRHGTHDVEKRQRRDDSLVQRYLWGAPRRLSCGGRDRSLEIYLEIAGALRRLLWLREAHAHTHAASAVPPGYPGLYRSARRLRLCSGG